MKTLPPHLQLKSKYAPGTGGHLVACEVTGGTTTPPTDIDVLDIHGRLALVKWSAGVYCNRGERFYNPARIRLHWQTFRKRDPIPHWNHSNFREVFQCGKDGRDSKRLREELSLILFSNHLRVAVNHHRGTDSGIVAHGSPLEMNVLGMVRVATFEAVRANGLLEHFGKPRFLFDGKLEIQKWRLNRRLIDG